LVYVEIDSEVGGGGEALFLRFMAYFLIGAWWSYLLELYEFIYVFLVKC